VRIEISCVLPANKMAAAHWSHLSIANDLLSGLANTR